MPSLSRRPESARFHPKRPARPAFSLVMLALGVHHAAPVSAQPEAAPPSAPEPPADGAPTPPGQAPTAPSDETQRDDEKAPPDAPKAESATSAGDAPQPELSAPSAGAGEHSPPTPPADPAPQVVAPVPVNSPAASYPATHLKERRVGTVVLQVTVGVDGAVADPEVVQSAGTLFDQAALAAVSAWRFEPALRDGQPVAARIRIPFEFTPPPLPAPKPKRKPKPKSDGHDHGAVEITVHGARQPRTEARSASDFKIGRDVLEAAPRQEGAEVLRTAPGLYIGRGEGAAVAHNYMLRGFDAEHGQDIEFKVGGLPMNEPSHIHGQGYADLGFLIAPTVSELNVSEGVYDPSQGDFAVAGSIDVQLGVKRRGVRLETGYGAFDTRRATAIWAPLTANEQTFGAASVSQSDGFGDNRASTSGSGIFQQHIEAGERNYRAIAIVHTARAGMAGVVRRDDVDAGRVCFLCVYPQSSAWAQNALSSRFAAGVFTDTMTEQGDNSELGAWVSLSNFRVQQNFTGYIERSNTLAGVAGRGDLIEQRNRTLSAGLTGRYRSDRFYPSQWSNGTLELGTDLRLDDVEQSQNLIEGTRGETWDERVDANVLGMDLGVWGDLDWVFTQYAHARAGLRADVLSYDVDDRLGNFAELSRPDDSYLPGFRRSALGIAWGPRASLELHPTQTLSVLVAYGEGYRSPQARSLADSEPAPFTKVRSGDLGLHLDLEELLHVATAAYFTQLSDDIAFDASEGRLERIGATRRVGAVAHAFANPWPWLLSSVSVTYVHATLLEPPPATPEDPQPPFEEGQALPYVPPVVVRGDVGFKKTLRENLQGAPLGVSAGTGVSHLSPRPLPFGAFSEPVTLLDASVGVSWGLADLRLEAFNLLDQEYAAMEYNFASDWEPTDGVRPRTPARHISAGAPLSWMVSLGVQL